MITKRPVGVSFPKDATQNSTPRGTLPVPSIRSGTGRGDIGFDRGNLLELLARSFNDLTAVSMQWTQGVASFGKETPTDLVHT